MKYKLLLLILFVIPTFIYGDDGEPQTNLPGITEQNGKLYINSPPGEVLNIKATDLPSWASTNLVTVGAMAICVGPPDSIISGDQNVIFEDLPVARLGDKTLHGGEITEGSKKIFINGVPAAFVGGMHVCPMITGTVPHIGGPIVYQGRNEGRSSIEIPTPSVINSTPNQAEGILNEVGLILNIKWGKQATEREQVGKIYQQLPKEGQTIKPGGKIDAWVYNTEVPAVVETPFGEAKPAITAAWFKPQKGKEIEVENKAKWNNVAAQSLAAGKKVLQVDLPVTLDVYVKPKKKETDLHPLVGHWETFITIGKHTKKSFFEITSVDKNGKANIVMPHSKTDIDLGMDSFIVKENKITGFKSKEVDGDTFSANYEGIWDKKKTIKSTVTLTVSSPKSENLVNTFEAIFKKK